MRESIAILFSCYIFLPSIVTTLPPLFLFAVWLFCKSLIFNSSCFSSAFRSSSYWLKTYSKEDSIPPLICLMCFDARGFSIKISFPKQRASSSFETKFLSRSSTLLIFARNSFSMRIKSLNLPCSLSICISFSFLSLSSILFCYSDKCLSLFWFACVVESFRALVEPWLSLPS